MGCAANLGRQRYDPGIPHEKLIRDARAMLIADGCNELLAVNSGSQLVNPQLL